MAHPCRHVVVHVASTVIVGVAAGQQVAAQGTVVVDKRIQSGTMHPVTGGQLRGLVDVEVGQYGIAEVVMVVTYVVGVGVQLAGLRPAATWADTMHKLV